MFEKKIQFHSNIHFIVNDDSGQDANITSKKYFMFVTIKSLILITSVLCFASEKLKKRIFLLYIFFLNRSGAREPLLAINWLIYKQMFTLQANYGELQFTNEVKDNTNGSFESREINER